MYIYIQSNKYIYIYIFNIGLYYIPLRTYLSGGQFGHVYYFDVYGVYVHLLRDASRDPSLLAFREGDQLKQPTKLEGEPETLEACKKKDINHNPQNHGISKLVVLREKRMLHLVYRIF